MEENIKFPTIHLNGSSIESLISQFEQANHALAVATDELVNCAPHARDYYVQSANDFSKAAREHQDRIARLKGVREEICEILNYLYDKLG